MLTFRKLSLVALALTLGLTATGRATEPDKLMPPDAEIVVVLNVRQTLDAPVVRKNALDLLKTVVAGNAEVKTVLEAVGIDPFKDIETILISNAGKMDKEGNNFVAVRGNFDPMKITAQAGKAGLKASLVQGLAIYEVKGGEEAMFLTVLNRNTILASTKKDYLVKAATGGIKNGKNLERLKASLARIQGTPSFTLGMVISDELKTQLKTAIPGNEQGSMFLDNLESVSGSINVNDDADCRLMINTADAKTAENLTGLIKLFLPAAKEEIAKQQGVPAVVSTILANLHVVADKNAVVFDVKVTDKMVKDALEGK